MPLTILQGDCRDLLRTLPEGSVDCCVTSPPYWGLRDYGVEGQLGQEPTPEEFIENMTAVFREVRRVLKPEGTCWVNMGDSYAGGGGHCPTAPSSKHSKSGKYGAALVSGGIKPQGVVKAKDLVGIPWMLAFALRADGWYLRQDIIWHKPNPMPESVTDRCTKAHEYIFLLSKSASYFYDADAIKEKASENTNPRTAGNVNPPKGQLAYENGAKEHRTKAGLLAYAEKCRKHDPGEGNKNNASFDAAMAIMPDTRNKRSVWTVPSAPYKEAHFATYPPALIRPCILAGCPVGGVVLDPFGGSGTTGEVAIETGRRAILMELKPDYVGLIRRRTAVTIGLGL